MTEYKLPTNVWVAALIRRAELAGASGFVVHKGDGQRGDVLIKAVTPRGTAVRLFVPHITMQGDRAFVNLLSGNDDSMDEAAADAYIARARARDGDLWVIEIEDRDNRHFISDPVEDG